jgi:hypothetical protein
MKYPRPMLFLLDILVRLVFAAIAFVVLIQLPKLDFYTIFYILLFFFIPETGIYDE